MTFSNQSISRSISIILSIIIFLTIILSPLPTRKVFAETLNTETDLQNEKISDIETNEQQPTNSELAPLEPEPIETLPEDPAENYLARVSEYVDEKGFVTDGALESFALPEAEEEQFYEIVENEDGSQEMKLYLQPIKYKDSNDEWADIDHSLILKETSAAQATTSTIAKKFETKAADVKISLSEDLSSENAIVYSYGDYEIGFSPQNIIKKDSVESAETVKLVEETVSQNSSNVSAFTAKDLASGSLIKNLDKAEFESLEYEKTFNEDASIKITPTYMGVKEEIILDSLPAETKFSYILNVDELVPLLREDGNLYFVDFETNTIIATIAAPVMWDSAVEFKESYDITVTIEALGDNQYRYTLIPDRAFLEAEDTVYPVIIDPTINTTTSNIVDTFIASKISSKNYSSDTHMKIGYSATFKKSRGMIQINSFPSVLAGNEITKVTFNAYQDYSGNSSPQMDICKITESWNVTTVDWDVVPDYSGIAAYTTVKAIGAYTWDITNLAKGWYNGSIANYGMYIKINNESLNQYKRFCAEENSTAANRPYFAFTFKDTTPPPAPTSLSISSSTFSGTTGTVKLTWSSVTDLPSGYASGLSYYQFRYRKNDGSWTTVNTGTTTNYTISSVSSNASYDYQVRAVDKNGNASSWKQLNNQSTPDKIGPTAPTSFTISPTGWTQSKPTITWSGITDNGDHLQKVQYQIGSGSWTNIGTSNGTTSGSYTIDMSSKADGEYTIKIRGVDSEGNNGTASFAVTYKKDTTAPTISSFTANKTTLNGIVKISAVITNPGGSAFSNWTLQYGLGNPASTFSNTLASGTSVTSGVIFEWDTSELVNNNYYTLRLTEKDSVGNTATAPLITLLKTENSVYVASEVQITSPASGVNADQTDDAASTIDNAATDVTYTKTADNTTTGLQNQKLYVNNVLHDEVTSTDSTLTFNAAEYDTTSGWKYPEGSIANIYVQAKDSSNNVLYSTGTYEAKEIYDTFKDSSKIKNLQNVEVLSSGIVRLNDLTTANVVTGSLESNTLEFAGDVSYIDLIVDQTVPSAGGNIVYSVSVDNGATWQIITPVSTNGGTTKNIANRKYFENAVGDNVTLKATLTKPSGVSLSPTINSWEMDVRYTTYTNAVVIDNTFPENTRGIRRLENTVHDEENGCIKAILPADGTENYVYSTLRTTPNNVIEVCLEVDEYTPAGTDIIYSVSLQGGTEGTWQTITPGDSNDLDTWVTITNPGNQIVLRAKLDSSENITPILNSWKLNIKQKTAGQPYVVKLIDEPQNLSTLVGSNYKILLRWEASETTGVTYNVYRSETPYFDLTDAELVAEGLTETYWNDYNLNYGKTFYYKVTAVKSFSGHARESLPSYEAWATVVDEDEVNKMLGLQDYWTYSGFTTGSGTGYVNVANGNVVYTTTDILVSDPFLAAVMRRTFNSEARTKTAMGYGWDYSFNTALLKEFSAAGIETGMILKDGDGSLHRFEKTAENTYESAKGTFMKLIYNSELNEYQIKRKDGIVYHYDAQTMQLEKFSDANGNVLSFTYDDRGNVVEVENNVGEVIELSYIVSNAEIGDPDYNYINEHPDMLASVSWTPEGTTSSDIVYNYTYTADDVLSSARSVIENDTTYEESFTYTDGKLTKITDPANKDTALEYDENNRIKKITLANGDHYTFAYVQPTGGNVITTVTDKYGVSVEYRYDENGLLKKKTDALNHWVAYTHDSDYLVTSMSYPDFTGGAVPLSYTYTYENGNIKSVSGPEGSGTTYTYTGNGLTHNKPTSETVKKTANSTITTSYIYDENGNLLKATDPLGMDITSTYGYRTETDTAHGYGYLLSETNQYGGVTSYAYDAKGRVSAVTVKNAAGIIVDSQSYTYAYNDGEYYNSVAVTDAFGKTTKTYYDKLGRECKVLYPDGEYTIKEYDLVGNVTRTRDRAGNEVRYTYDDIHRMISASYPDSTSNTISYSKWDSDNNGTNESDLIIKTDGEGVRTAEYYDKAGRLVKTSILGKTNSDAEIVTARYEYDSIGNCTLTTDNAGRKVKAEYNKLGQNIKTIADPEGENIVVQYTYDLLGNQLSVTDAAGGRLIYTYDAGSRLSQVKQKLGTEYLTTSYAYDDETSHSGYITNKVTDANGNVKEAVFDAAGRKIRDIDIGSTTDNTQMSTTYSYNKSRVSTVTRNDNSKESYTYNDFGQITRVNYYEAAEDISHPSDEYLVYGYDELGNVTSESIYHGTTETTTTYTYDSMGRLASTTQGSLASGGVEIDYTYNGADQVTAVTYVKGVDENNAAAERTLGYSYDNYGRLFAITLKTGSASPKTVRQYFYKENGELDYTKDFRNFEAGTEDYIKTAYTVNDLGLTTKITYTDYVAGSTTGTKKEEYTMAYDKRGYITSETAYTNYGTAETVNKTYTYDNVGRLTKATVGDEEKNYTYDSVGNRLTMSDGTDTYAYTYNQFNQLKTVKKNGSAYASYTYDSRGNQTRESQVYMTVGDTKYNQVTDYTYDLRNQMIKAKITTPDYVNNAVVNNEVIQTNAYNASDQRIQKIEDGETTNYYYMGSALLLSANANNWLLTENILDPNGTIVASARFDDTNPGTAEGFYFYHYDMRGSTTAIVGTNGNLQKGYTYDEFGSIEESGNVSFLNEVTFTGSVTDTSTGLQYMNSRYYDSSTGRFLTQDSYSGNPYDPWTQHLYSYCGNNPVNMVDPTGHFCISAIIIGAIVGAVIGAGIVGYQDYKDDGKIFNGSKTVGNYLMGAAVGGVVGAAAGTAVAVAAGGTAATAGLSALGKAAVSAGSAGAIGAGTNAAIQAASKGITNVDGKEAALAGVKSAAVSFVCSGLGSLAKGSGAGQSLYNSKGSPSPGSAVQDKTADVGRKLDYMFGKATGSTHNLNRTVQMQGQLSRIGLFDNDAGRSYIEQQMNNVLNDPTSIVRVQENGRILRQSLLTGPNGALDMETVWEGSKLITVNLFGKEINWFS